MDAQKASYSITLMAKVLGVTRAGYYAWKSCAGRRAQRALARGRGCGVRAVAASMRRLGLTGLHARRERKSVDGAGRRVLR